MKFSQTVIAAVPERTYQATILQLTAPQSITVQRPVDAIPGRGGIDVRMQAKLGGDLPGVREYFQLLSRTRAWSNAHPRRSDWAIPRNGRR